jgi:hypothetical protein
VRKGRVKIGQGCQSHLSLVRQNRIHEIRRYRGAV